MTKAKEVAEQKGNSILFTKAGELIAKLDTLIEKSKTQKLKLAEINEASAEVCALKYNFVTSDKLDKMMLEKLLRAIHPKRSFFKRKVGANAEVYAEYNSKKQQTK